MRTPTTPELEGFLARDHGLRERLGVGPEVRLSLRPLARGEYNINYHLDGVPGEPLVLRVNLGSQMGLADQISYEMDALTLLGSSGRTPRPLWWDGSLSRLPWGVAVEQWLPGGPLDYGRDLVEAARILADVHAVPLGADHGLIAPTDPLGAMVTECVSMADVYRGWARADDAVVAVLDAMERQCRQLVSRGEGDLADALRHPINTEVNSGNFLIVPGESGHLVDWEKPLAADVAQDLAHFLVPTTTLWRTDVVLTASERARFLEAYVAAVDGRFDLGDLTARLAPYLTVTCLRGLSWCAMARVEDEEGIRPVADALTGEKVAAFLAPDFTTMLLERWF